MARMAAASRKRGTKSSAVRIIQLKREKKKGDPQ